MNVQHSWLDTVPDNVGQFVYASTAATYIPRSTDEWQCVYAFTDTHDMDVIGYCSYGPRDGQLLVVSKAHDFTVLTALVASACESMPSTTLPVVAFDEQTIGILRFLGFEVSQFARSDDGRGGNAGVESTGLHDAAHSVRGVLLAGDEEGEET